MGFQIFDTFIGAVYYYLVRDVVPEEVYGRFMGVFRLVGALAPLVYNLFVFGHAEQHMKLIFVVISVIYGIGIYAMCWRVKEGDFPPPEKLRGDVSNPWRRLIAAVRTYLADCFTHPIYWFFFLAMGMMTWGTAAGVFAVLFQRDELGINLATQGKLGAAGNIVVLIFALPLGYLVDKLNSFRIVQVCVLPSGITTGLGWFFIQGVPSLFAFTLTLSAISIGSMLAINKVMLRLIPKEKYGQFGSANSAFSSLGMVLMSILAAKFVDAIGSYRAYLLWSSMFVMGATPFFILCERMWLKLGGAKSYKAP
jgi:MFS family permease